MCTRADVCSFRRDENKRGKVMRPSSLAPKSQTQCGGKILREQKLSAAGCRLGRDLEDRAKTASVASARNHCDFWHLWYVKITEQNLDANAVTCNAKRG